MQVAEQLMQISLEINMILAMNLETIRVQPYRYVKTSKENVLIHLLLVAFSIS